MTEKTDLRIQRTYKLLTDALMEMLSEMDFEQITVRELCERAMVRPATFYKHFADKYEFFTFVIGELLQQFLQSEEIERDPENPEAFHVGMIEQTFRFMETNKAIVSHTIQGGSAHVLLDLLSEQTQQQILQQFREDRKSGYVLPVEPELLAVIFTGALVNVLKWWAVNDFHPEREELVRQCSNVIAFCIHGTNEKNAAPDQENDPAAGTA